MSSTCISPPELEDKQLFAYLDDHNSDQETALHLKRCSHCRKRVEALDRLHKSLSSRLYRSTCPSSLTLGEYHLRMLPASQMLVVAQHVRECPHCARETAELKDFLSEFAQAQKDLHPGKGKTIIARLIGGQTEPGSHGEHSLAPAFATLRGEGQGPIVLGADGIVILLGFAPATSGQVSIIGQVAADNQEYWTGAAVELQQTEMTPLIASVDDLGAFTFEALPASPIQITITSLDGTSVQTPNIQIDV